MSTTKTLLALAWLAGPSFPTRAFVLRQVEGAAGDTASGDGEKQGKGKGKTKGKGKDGPERAPPTTPRSMLGLVLRPIQHPVPAPRRVDGGSNAVEQPDGPNNEGREGAQKEDQPPGPESPVLAPEIPDQAPAPVPPQSPPPPPSPETTAPALPAAPSVQVGQSTTASSLSVPALSSSTPTPARSFPPAFTQPSVTTPDILQPFPRPSLPSRSLQSSSLVPDIVVTQVPPSSQPTDAGSGLPTLSAPAATSSTSLTGPGGAMGDNTTSQGIGGNRSLVIALSTVLSLLGVVMIVGAICLCYRYRHGRLPFSRRGNTPIDDEEIESWKACRTIEKCTTIVVDDHDQHGSAASVRKPASVIVYQENSQYQPRMSTDTTSRSLYHKRSMDKKSIDIPQAPVFARAPNARVGLTDDTVEGDLAFIPSPKRRNSRLSKLPPLSPRHGRHRSSRSSISIGSLRDHWYGYHIDVELSPRASADPYTRMPSSAHSDGKHQRVYSSPSNPPRLSLDEEHRLGGLSPRPDVRRSRIGLAVG